MSLTVALVADDLTGALDSTTPFVERGYSVAIAIDPQHIDAAIATGADVVGVNAGSRHLDPIAAARVTEDCARRLANERPRLCFKKLDSRLRGNVAAELLASSRGFGTTRTIMVPAVPGEGRTVTGGRLHGSGIAAPMNIAAYLNGATAVEIPETPDQRSIDRLAHRAVAESGVLLAGARGLARAVASALPEGRTRQARAYYARLPMTLAIGSRDPIALSQIAKLQRERPDTVVTRAPNGALPDAPPGDASIRVFMATPSTPEIAEAVVAACFAEGMAGEIAARPPATLFLSGGDTALDVLQALGVGVVRPLGEGGRSVAWFEIQVAGRVIAVLTKSGGFGAEDALLRLLAQPLSAPGGIS